MKTARRGSCSTSNNVCRIAGRGPVFDCTSVINIAIPALLTFALTLLLSCAGPQPLSVAIDPQDELEYVAKLNKANADARAAYASWIAPARNTSPEQFLLSDADTSETRNPFDAHNDSQAVSRGAVMYMVHCARCHGEDARGLGPSILPDHPATDFKTFGKRFAATVHRGAPRKWFRVIRDGSGDTVVYPDGEMTAMPPFGESLTREQIWLVITYLQSLDQHAEKS